LSNALAGSGDRGSIPEHCAEIGTMRIPTC
jgi:hypothetical protein